MNRFPKQSARQAAQKPAKATALGKTAFQIENMDPLGQGVFRDNGNIGFIAKTLPGEEGVAQVVKAKKGVKFATLKTLSVTSPERIEPECPHFAECPGCHYLHTPYNNELAYKKQALQHLLYKLDVDADNIEMLPAEQRLAYRNRIQLHYRKGKIGLIDGLTDSIVEIPHCKILREELQPELDKLYTDNSWQKDHKKEGHCELYLKEEGVQVEWDKDYAHGGFTQVFEAMNTRLCAEVNTFLTAKKPATLLDLFAGNGNLSNAFVADNPTKRVMVDATPHQHNDFVALDLLADNALQKFQKRCKEKAFDVLLLDPPRKGFPELNAWVKTFQPKALVYVSCNPATLARDLQSLEGKFEIEKVQLIDLFPGTYHFETVVFVSYKRHGK